MATLFSPIQAVNLSYSASPTVPSASLSYDAKSIVTGQTIKARITPLNSSSDRGSTGKTLTVYHQYGPNSARRYELTESQQDQLQRHYQALKTSYAEDRASRFVVDFTSQTASYTVNGEQKIVALKQNDQDAYQATALMKKEIYRGNFQRHHFDSKSKGSCSGTESLQRPPQSGLSQLLLYGTSQANPAKYEAVKASIIHLVSEGKARDLAKERIECADTKLLNLDKWRSSKRLEKLKPQEEAFQTLLTNAYDGGSKGQIPVLEEELREVDSQFRQANYELAEIEKIDVYALYHALAFYPEKSDDVRAAADKVYERVLKETEERFNNSWIPDLPLISRWRNQDQVRQYKDYAADVGGLMFAPLGAAGRVQYIEYCRDKGISVKKQSFEDEIMREAIKQTSYEYIE